MSRLLEVKIAPISTEPDVISTEDAKDYCRVDFTEDDSLFQQLIASSRLRLERYLCRVFLRSVCNAIYTQECGGDRILLSYSDNMVMQSGSQYATSLVGESYINTNDTVVMIEYTAGYEEIPEWIEQAVLMDVAYRYENRGEIPISAGINGELKEFLRPYVKWSFL